MDELLKYLNGLPADAREAFASKCGTSVAYLRKAVSIGQKLGDGLCIAIERESDGAVRCESMRPDIDWAYLRGSANHGSSRPPFASAAEASAGAADTSSATDPAALTA